MPINSRRFWEDKELLLRVSKFTAALFAVFRLDGTKTNYDIEVAISRIAANELTSGERDRLGTQSPEFQDEVLALPKALPRSWDALHKALHDDFHNDLSEKAKASLEKSVVTPRPTLPEVIEQSSNLLFWLIVREVLVLVQMIEESGSFFSWLDVNADKAVKRFANPSWIFKDWSRLRKIGEAWETYRVKNELPNAKGCTVELIARVLHEKPIPPEIAEFLAELRDGDQARDLHAPMAAALSKATRFWPLINRGKEVPEYKLAFDILLERLTWQAVKNARKYSTEKRSGAKTWLPRLLGRKNFRNLCIQAINMAAGLPANYNCRTARPQTVLLQTVPKPTGGRRKKCDLLRARINEMPPEMDRQKWVLKDYLDLTGDDSCNQSQTPEELEDEAINTIAKRFEITAQQVWDDIKHAVRWLKRDSAAPTCP